MGNTTNIKISVDTLALQNLSNGTQPPTNDGISWAVLSQSGKGTGTQTNKPGTQTNDPSLFLSDIYKDDIITWSGEAPIVDNPRFPGQNLRPIIHITGIDFIYTDDSGVCFDMPWITTPTDGTGSTVSTKALKTISSPITYHIKFEIVYKQRVLDPKIKISSPPSR